MIPVVVLTSSREERDMVASYKLGVNAYVVKPVDFHEFVNAIKELGIFWAVINEPPPGSVRKKWRIISKRTRKQMKPPLRILHLEDNPTDAELIQAILETEGIICDVTRVDTQADFFASLEHGGFDLILTDYTLPSFDGLSALKIALEKCPDVPFIFVSGTLGEEVAIEALKIGATDYILKQRLSRIVPSVHRALREAKERGERKRAEALLAGEKRLLEMIAQGMPSRDPRRLVPACRRAVRRFSRFDSVVGSRRQSPLAGAAPNLPRAIRTPSTVADRSCRGIVRNGGLPKGAGDRLRHRDGSAVGRVSRSGLTSRAPRVLVDAGTRLGWPGTGNLRDLLPRAAKSDAQQQSIIKQITDLASIAIERKRAEEERQAHLGFLESMDQVNRAIQGTNDLEQMMSDVLDACFRSSIATGRGWSIPVTRRLRRGKCRWSMSPGISRRLRLGTRCARGSGDREVFRTVRAASGPVRFGPGAAHPLPAEMAKRFGIQSRIVMALYPKGDKPYMLGLTSAPTRESGHRRKSGFSRRSADGWKTL